MQPSRPCCQWILALSTQTINLQILYPRKLSCLGEWSHPPISWAPDQCRLQHRSATAVAKSWITRNKKEYCMKICLWKWLSQLRNRIATFSLSSLKYPSSRQFMKFRASTPWKTLTENSHRRWSSCLIRPRKKNSSFFTLILIAIWNSKRTKACYLHPAWETILLTLSNKNTHLSHLWCSVPTLMSKRATPLITHRTRKMPS